MGEAFPVYTAVTQSKMMFCTNVIDPAHTVFGIFRWQSADL